MSSKESCSRRPESERAPELTRKRRLPRTETTKYKVREEEGNLGLRKPQVDRVLRTRNDQAKRGETTSNIPMTEIVIPMTT